MDSRPNDGNRESIGSYSKSSAYTIHKQIYYPKSDSSGKIEFQLKPNKYRKTIFIVDEASMISDDRNQSKIFENGSLLNDLTQYVGQGDKCKLIFVGDPAQLPPIHLNLRLCVLNMTITCNSVPGRFRLYHDDIHECFALPPL